MMHLSKRFAASAMGGFKIINGLPKMGKGPMESEESLKSSNEASLPQPTQAGRIETCTESINKAMRCLGNGDKDCVTRLIEELIKANCHDGRLIGKEIADGVREIVHELWLRSDYESRCRLLRILKYASKKWVKKALHINAGALNTWFVRCRVDWKGRVSRNDVVKIIEDLLREKLGWNEIKMCEELWRFVGVNVEAFRRYGVEPCDWVHAEFDDVYFMGIVLSDLHVNFVKFDKNKYVNASLCTSNAIGTVLFSLLLQPIQRPSISIRWFGKETGIVEVEYFVTVRADKWWTNREELIGRVRALGPVDIPKLIAGVIDGDGTIRYDFNESRPIIEFTTCKACRKRVFLDALQETLEKIGIDGKIYESGRKAVLMVYGENAIKLLRLIMPYLRHPLRRLRAKLILMLYEGRIDYETFTELYEQTKYELGGTDVKRNNALAAAARATPQTHTHGT